MTVPLTEDLHEILRQQAEQIEQLQKGMEQMITSTRNPHPDSPLPHHHPRRPSWRNTLRCHHP